MGIGGNTGGNHGAGTNPYAICQGNALNNQVKGWFLIIMIARQQYRSLRQANIIAKCNRHQAINPHIFTYPAMAADA